MSEEKENRPQSKYCKYYLIYLYLVEIKMPDKGKEIKIKHGLDVTKIINVNVIILNGNKSNIIIRSQIDMMSQKALYSWYVDRDNFVLIRPNNVIEIILSISNFFIIA